jgi:molecular chaperone DnaK
MKATIDYGIDLGTTNSAIAHQSGTQTEIIDAPDGLLVPSVVHIASDNSIRVGRAAVQQRTADPANVASEFKRLMGTSERIIFSSANRCMTPVELSAEVLKDLLRRAQRRNGGDRIEAAVITIPAMFQLPQCEATREAARLAGLKYAPLLQEPIAAAIASVGSAELRDGYWLVYDFGGGTFDVSLVRSRAGRLQVLDHDGDNHLGGKDFDRLLVRRAADAVRAEGKISNFRRSIPAFEPAFERLKAEAERVRVALSGTETERFHVDGLAVDDVGLCASVDFVVTRAELEALIRPIIGRTMDLCRKMLDRNELAPSELKRVVLVGGPTLTPCLPKILETELGVEARHYADPSEAVAIGAAIYASTQRFPSELRRSGEARAELSTDLSFESMTNDARPVVAGQIKGPRGAGDWRVLISSRPERFASGRVPVRADGTFVVRINLAPNALNVFEFNVYCDDTIITVLSDTFSIIHGTTIAKPVLSQSVGVVLADNSVRWYLKKGVVLPAQHKASHATTLGLRRGQTGTAVHIPLIQGESDFGDRNTIVGLIEIKADNIPLDLPIGSEVVVTLSVDEHSTTSAEAYVPLLDQTFNQIVKFGLETRTSQDIRKDVEGQRARLAELEKIANELDKSQEGGIDSRVKVIEDLLEEGGADERNQADQLLKNLTGTIDNWKVRDQEDLLRQQFVASDEQIRKLIKDDDKERQRQHAALSDEFSTAIARADLQLAEAKFKAVKELEWALLREQPGFWIRLFEYLSKEVLKGPNAAEARIPIDQGKAAINRNDLKALVQACMTLIRLLPKQEQAQLPLIVKSHVA